MSAIIEIEHLRKSSIKEKLSPLSVLLVLVNQRYYVVLIC